MAKLDLHKLLIRKGWNLSDLAKASGITQAVLRMLADQVFEPTPQEHRLILEAFAKPDSRQPDSTKIPHAKSAAEPQGGQLDLFGGQP